MSPGLYLIVFDLTVHYYNLFSCQPCIINNHQLSSPLHPHFHQCYHTVLDNKKSFLRNNSLRKTLVTCYYIHACSHRHWCFRWGKVNINFNCRKSAVSPPWMLHPIPCKVFENIQSESWSNTPSLDLCTIYWQVRVLVLCHARNQRVQQWKWLL